MNGLLSGPQNCRSHSKCVHLCVCVCVHVCVCEGERERPLLFVFIYMFVCECVCVFLAWLSMCLKHSGSSAGGRGDFLFLLFFRTNPGTICPSIATLGRPQENSEAHSHSHTHTHAQSRHASKVQFQGTSISS